ncbi:hypothetical protein [Puniceicoccus vermicola]|uniref:Uncharacterized protein n=1 Tax=Puniceicoccus vermicola TaxID=388746 RepID=A0A7X1E2J4_9BACT|nr:hypothetical protein [Puniceicoccus vermicola]MBC2600530.1 hypothetical protein [Puniceicoccus vermicola]
MNELFTVKDRFKITGRGIVLITGISADEDPPAYTGQKIIIVSPDGKEKIETEIRSIEFVLLKDQNEEYVVPICLPEEIEKETVQVGSKVYLKPTKNIPSHLDNA